MQQWIEHVNTGTLINLALVRNIRCEYSEVFYRFDDSHQVSETFETDADAKTRYQFIMDVVDVYEDDELVDDKELPSDSLELEDCAGL